MAAACLFVSTKKMCDYILHQHLGYMIYIAVEIEANIYVYITCTHYSMALHSHIFVTVFLYS